MFYGFDCSRKKVVREIVKYDILMLISRNWFVFRFFCYESR